MTFRWTDTLQEPLASVGRGHDWLRVERVKDGGWVARSADGRWYDVDERCVRARDPLQDKRLRGIRHVVPDALTGGSDVRLLAWRIGRRAVLRVANGSKAHIVKIYHKDREQALRWGALPDARDRPWRRPEVLEWNPDSRTMKIEFCPGRSLNERWLAAGSEPEDARRIAEVLGWLALAPIPSGFPRYGPADEIRLLLDRLASFHDTLKKSPPRADEIAERVIRALEVAPDSPVVLCHRDLHDKQLLIDGRGRGTLLDLDLAAAGPAALDVGNILGHLRLRALQGTRVRWREIAEDVARRAVPARGASESLPRWTAATLLRLALIYCRRRRSATLVDRLLESTEQALDRAGEWAGIL